jgi:23S rRNA (guanosine2251-2'-O)-methyltransferase
LLRSAEVFGVDAVLLPRRRSAPLGAAAAKASAGAIEHLWIDQVPNLERALATCRDEGIWVVALDAAGGQDLRDCALLAEPVVLVVGAEGRGVSRLIRSRADAVVAIATTGRVTSLNASAAGAVCLWEAASRRASSGHPG